MPFNATHCTKYSTPSVTTSEALLTLSVSFQLLPLITHAISLHLHDASHPLFFPPPSPTLSSSALSILSLTISSPYFSSRNLFLLPSFFSAYTCSFKLSILPFPPSPPLYFNHHFHANPLFSSYMFAIISPLLFSSPLLFFSRFLTLVLSICRKKSCPSPLFSEAPSTRPGMSAIVTRSKSEYSTTPVGILKWESACEESLKMLMLQFFNGLLEQTDRQTDWLTGIHTYIRTDRQTKEHLCRQMDRQTDRQTYIYT